MCKQQARGIDRDERWMDIGGNEIVCSLTYLNGPGTKAAEVGEATIEAVLMFPPSCVPSQCIRALPGTLGNLTVIDSIFL